MKRYSASDYLGSLAARRQGFDPESRLKIESAELGNHRSTVRVDDPRSSVLHVLAYQVATAARVEPQDIPAVGAVQHGRSDTGLNRFRQLEEDRAQGDAGREDPRAIDVRAAVAIDVHAGLDDPNQLDEVRQVLAIRITAVHENSSSRCADRALAVIVGSVAVQVVRTSGDRESDGRHTAERK